MNFGTVVALQKSGLLDEKDFKAVQNSGKFRQDDNDVGQSEPLGWDVLGFGA